MRVDFVGHCAALFCVDDFELFLRHGRLHDGVVAEVLLRGDEQEGDVGAEVVDLGDPLGVDVLETVGQVDGKAHQNDVRVGVGERAETIVVLLACTVIKEMFIMCDV